MGGWSRRWWFGRLSISVDGPRREGASGRRNRRRGLADSQATRCPSRHDASTARCLLPARRASRLPLGYRSYDLGPFWLWLGILHSRDRFATRAVGLPSALCALWACSTRLTRGSRGVRCANLRTGGGRDTGYVLTKLNLVAGPRAGRSGMAARNQWGFA